MTRPWALAGNSRDNRWLGDCADILFTRRSPLASSSSSSSSVTADLGWVLLGLLLNRRFAFCRTLAGRTLARSFLVIIPTTWRKKYVINIELQVCPGSIFLTKQNRASDESGDVSTVITIRIFAKYFILLLYMAWKNSVGPTPMEESTYLYHNLVFFWRPPWMR